jgi:hypothetical protein
VSQDDFTSIIFPIMVKAALRSPEISLSCLYFSRANRNASNNCLTAMAQFFHTYSWPITTDAFHRISTLAFDSAKSSNPIVRTHAIELFKAILRKDTGDEDVKSALGELLSLPKAGKTTGPDHRLALYTMLSSLCPSPGVSTVITQAIPPLLAKETHDAAMSTLAAALPPHIVYLLRINEPIPVETINLMIKEMTNAKPAIRRSFCSVIGTTFWEYGNLETDASFALANTTLPPFETNLKNISANPLSSNTGCVEGYIGLAVLLGPFSRSGNFGRHHLFSIPDFVPMSPHR